MFIFRHSDLAQIKSLVRRHRRLCLVGPKDIGKSYLWEGLEYQLRPDGGGYMAKAGAAWKTVILKLTHEEIERKDPIELLANALAKPGILNPRDQKLSPSFRKEVLQILSKNDKGLIQLYKKFQFIQGFNLLLVIDPFDLVLKLKSDKRDKFSKLLIQASKSKEVGIYVGLAIRSETFKLVEDRRDQRHLAYLADAMVEHHYTLYALSQTDLKDILLKSIEERSNGKIILDQELCHYLAKVLHRSNRQLADLDAMLRKIMEHYHRLMRGEDGELLLTQSDYQEIAGRQFEPLPDPTEYRDPDTVYDGLNAEEKMICEGIFRALVRRTDRRNQFECSIRGYRQLYLILNKPDETLYAGVLERFRRTNVGLISPDVTEKIYHETPLLYNGLPEGINWPRLADWVRAEDRLKRDYLQLSELARLYYSGEASLPSQKSQQSALKWWQIHEPNAAWAAQYSNNFKQVRDWINLMARGGGPPPPPPPPPSDPPPDVAPPSSNGEENRDNKRSRRKIKIPVNPNRQT